jgi:hypothetical protein
MDAEIKLDSIIAGDADAMLANPASQERSDLVNLQMILATSSMNHEYARKAYDKTRSFARRQELLVKMENLKNMYFAARTRLSENHPHRVEAIERELSYQKQAVLSENGMH